MSSSSEALRKIPFRPPPLADPLQVPARLIAGSSEAFATRR